MLCFIIKRQQAAQASLQVLHPDNVKNTQMDRTDMLLAIYIQLWLICRGYFDS